MESWTVEGAVENAAAILAEWVPDHNRYQCVALLGAILAAEHPLALLEKLAGEDAVNVFFRIMGALERG